MKVKKFLAPSMPEAMKMIRSELGNDAVILNSRVVQRGGIFGLFSKKNIEVIAAVDPKPIEKPHLKTSGRRLETVQSFKSIGEKQSNRTTLPVRGKIENPDAELLKEISELKSMLKELSTNVTTGFEQYPGCLSEVSTLLMEQGFASHLRQEIMATLLDRWYLYRGDVSFQQAITWTNEIILEKISKHSFGGITFQKKFINVVGPTGVGKTTTLAKIAAECVIKHRKKVAFITTDTYRIAAIDQLKTYAKILDVPLEVCYNIQDFLEAKSKFVNYDVVFIDTAGRNFRNQQYVSDLKSIIDFNGEMETFLVLSMTAKETDMREIFKQFSLINIDKFIFTKIDETSHYGAMINLITAFETGVAYLTNGQNVPDDIVEASPVTIVNTVLGVDG